MKKKLEKKNIQRKEEEEKTIRLMLNKGFLEKMAIWKFVKT